MNSNPIKNLVNEIIELYKDGKLSGKIVVLSGSHGLGQKEVLKNLVARFSSDSSTVILSVEPSDISFSLWPFWNALSSYITVEYNISKNYGEAMPSLNNGLNYEEYIFSKLVDLCKQSKSVILVCEDIQKCDQLMMSLFHRIIDYILPKYTFLFLCCNYNDYEDRGTAKSFFSEYIPYTRYFPFYTWKTPELEDYFHQLLGKVSVSEENLTALIDNAYGNPTILCNLIDYLKSQGILYESDNGFICNPFDGTVLMENVHKYVKNQYDRLSDDTKGILKSASIIGYEFDKNLLIHPLNFLFVDEQIKKIEKITLLIHEKKQNIFEFHSNAAFLSVKEIVEPDEYREWNLALGKYYYQCGCLNSRSGEYIEATDAWTRSAYYYHSANADEMEIKVYMQLLPLLVSIMHYQEAINTVGEIRKILNKPNPAMVLITKNDYNRLYLIEADCYYALFDYHQAADKYKCYLDKMELDNIESEKIVCRIALSLYDCGEMDHPYHMLLELYEKYRCKKKLSIQEAEVYVRVLSYLSSIEETYWNGEHIKHYELALSLAKKNKINDEYYVLLRKALIVYKGEIGINLMEQAQTYYRATNNRKEYAMVTHNMATEMLYWKDVEQAEAYFKESIRIFEDFGSQAVHYPMNGLGAYYLVSGQYKKALEILKKAYHDKYEDFSKIGILINQSTAYRQLKYFKKAAAALDAAEKIFHHIDADNYSILKPHFYLSKALLLKETGHYNEAMNQFNLYFDVEQSEHSHRLRIAAANMDELCTQYLFTPPCDYAKYLVIKSEPVNRLLKGNLVIVRFSFAE